MNCFLFENNLSYYNYTQSFLKMPVITRSQSKNRNICSALKIRPDPNNLLPWFIYVMKEGIADAANLFNKKKEEFFKNSKSQLYRTTHFELLRRITEIFYLINEYLPIIIEQGSRNMDKFTIVVYKKIHEFYRQVHESAIIPKCRNEVKIIKALLSTFQDVEKTVLPFLPKGEPTKRSRNIIIYYDLDASEDFQYSDYEYESETESEDEDE